MKNILVTKSLKEQVYEYLRDQIQTGEIKPNTAINLQSTSDKLGISKTPLRDALLQLDLEGFVTIKPRKGIIVNSLSLNDIRDFYQIIGALESTALYESKRNLKNKDIEKMLFLNDEMKNAIEGNKFDLYYENNLQLHNIFIKYSPNNDLKNIIEIKRRRLYDFPRKTGFIKDWEVESIMEHTALIKYIEDGKIQEASDYLRNVHWSFDIHEKFIRKYYEINQQ